MVQYLWQSARLVLTGRGEHVPKPAAAGRAEWFSASRRDDDPCAQLGAPARSRSCCTSPSHDVPARIVWSSELLWAAAVVASYQLHQTVGVPGESGLCHAPALHAGRVLSEAQVDALRGARVSGRWRACRYILVPLASASSWPQQMTVGAVLSTRKPSLTLSRRGQRRSMRLRRRRKSRGRAALHHARAPLP